MVTGIYRKISDTAALNHIEKFLRIISDLELEGIPAEKRPFAIYAENAATKRYEQRFFSNTVAHPFSTDHPQNNTYRGNQSSPRTPTGLYQITEPTYRGVLKNTGWPKTFDVFHQTIIAMYKLQERRCVKTNDVGDSYKRTAFGYLLEGDVISAIRETQLKDEWSSLPGGKSQKKDMEWIINRFNQES